MGLLQSRGGVPPHDFLWLGEGKTQRRPRPHLDTLEQQDGRFVSGDGAVVVAERRFVRFAGDGRKEVFREKLMPGRRVAIAVLAVAGCRDDREPLSTVHEV